MAILTLFLEPYLASAAAKTFNYLTKSLQASIGQQDLALLDVASKALMNDNLLKVITTFRKRKNVEMTLILLL